MGWQEFFKLMVVGSFVWFHWQHFLLLFYKLPGRRRVGSGAYLFLWGPSRTPTGLRLLDFFLFFFIFSPPKGIRLGISLHKLSKYMGPSTGGKVLNNVILSISDSFRFQFVLQSTARQWDSFYIDHTLKILFGSSHGLGCFNGIFSILSRKVHAINVTS